MLSHLIPPPLDVQPLPFVPPIKRCEQIASIEIQQWKQRNAPFYALFPGQREQEILKERTKVNVDRCTIAQLTYENPWGKAGGVFPVANALSNALIAAGQPSVNISPGHTKLKTSLAFESGTLPADCTELTKVAEIEVPFNGCRVPCNVFRAVHSSGSVWHLFTAKTFFEADGGKNKSDPYYYSHSDDYRLDIPGLARDSLFACAAVPEILISLGLTKDVVAHYHDWQFAGAALTILESLLKDDGLESAATSGTLHNTYDKYLPDWMLASISAHHENYRFPAIERSQFDRYSALTRFLPITTGPISAVSYQFKLDLLADPQQTKHFAPQLQDILRDKQLTGIGHGPFVNVNDFVFTESAIQAAKRGNVAPIYGEKQTYRDELLDTVLKNLDESIRIDIAKYRQAPSRDGALPKYGGRPIFLMGGRLEPSQKGFDVLAHAIRKLPKDLGLFIFSPVMSDEKLMPHLDFLLEVAAERAGDVIVLKNGLPRDLYLKLQRGVSYVVFPSLYEPFGAITESLVMGTPGIVRATGGLECQIIDYQCDPFHGNGFTFLENDPRGHHIKGEEWKWIHDTFSPHQRINIPLYANIVEALTHKLIEVGTRFKLSPLDYGRQLANVADCVKDLSWDGSVSLYLQMYARAAEGIFQEHS